MKFIRVSRISVGRGSVTKNIRGSFGGVVFRPKQKPFLQSSSANSSPRTPSNTSPDTLTITKNVTKNVVSANGWSRCHICNKKFLTPANLKQHMLLHQGGKPFRCNFCGLRFVGFCWLRFNPVYLSNRINIFCRGF